MELNFLFLAVSLRLSVGYHDLSLRQSDNPVSTAIFPKNSIAVTFQDLIHNPERHRRKQLC